MIIASLLSLMHWKTTEFDNWLKMDFFTVEIESFLMKNDLFGFFSVNNCFSAGICANKYWNGGRKKKKKMNIFTWTTWFCHQVSSRWGKINIEFQSLLVTIHIFSLQFSSHCYSIIHILLFNIIILSYLSLKNHYVGLLFIEWNFYDIFNIDMIE